MDEPDARRPADQHSPSPKEGSEPKGQPTTSHPTVLIVDDNRHVAETLALLLRHAGFQAATAGNGAEALEYLRLSPPPCLIVMDLMMPVMDGWTFRREQLDDPRLACIPLVVWSGAGEVQDDPAFEGIVGFEQKPADPERLLAYVRQCL